MLEGGCATTCQNGNHPVFVLHPRYFLPCCHLPETGSAIPTPAHNLTSVRAEGDSDDAVIRLYTSYLSRQKAQSSSHHLIGFEEWTATL